MRKVLSFYLNPTKDKSTGMVYTCLRVGSKVLDRRSTGIVVQKKYWKNPVVTSHHPNHLVINRKLKEVLDGGSTVEVGDYKSCALVFFDHWIERRYSNGAGNITNNTYLKYKQIQKSLSYGLKKHGRMDSFPFEYLKDEHALEILVMVLRRSERGSGFRSQRTSNNHLVVFKTAIRDWAKEMRVYDLGVFFGLEIKWNRRSVPKAKVMDTSSLLRFLEGVPTKKSFSQLVAKSVFLTSIGCVGQRVGDILTLRTENFKSGYKILFKVKKVRTDFEIDFTYEIMEGLKWIYTDYYDSACRAVSVKNTSIDISYMSKLLDNKDFVQRMGGLNLDQIHKYVLFLKGKDWHLSEEHREFWEALSVLVFEMRVQASHRFFDMIKRMPSKFLFPYLKEEDFTGVNWSKYDMTLEQTKVIQHGVAKYNRALARYCEYVDVPVVSSHSARHTFAHQLQTFGFSVEQIQQALNHTTYQTTQQYLQTRFSNDVAKEVARQRDQRFRIL